MLGSRTARTLITLLVAMTLGAFSLMLLESASVRLDGNLAAVTAPTDEIGQAVVQTEVPLKLGKWRNIVLHASDADGRDPAEANHFIVRYDAAADRAELVPTALWKRQVEGDHVRVPGFDYNATSIGICLMGEFGRQRPPARQYAALIRLTRKIQQTFSIAGDCVYLHSDLDRYSDSPGAAFPAEHFRSNLLRASR